MKDKNKGFSKANAILMKPKSFITKQERADFEDMTKDLNHANINEENLLKPVTINRVLSHIIKNRTRFNA